MKNSVYDDVPEEYSQLRKGWMFIEKIQWANQLHERFGNTGFLDFGCGTGDFVHVLAAAHPDVRYFWYDLNESYVRRAKSAFDLPNLSFHSDLSELRDEPLGLLYVNDVIHHFSTESDFFDTVDSLSFQRMAVMEPNQFNAYMVYFQATQPWERNFRQSRFESEAAERGYRILEKGYRFVFPNSVKELSSAMAAVNRGLENFRFVGGAVAYVLERG